MGDVGHLDDEGFLYPERPQGLHDHLRRGEYLSAGDREHRSTLHPKVFDVAVIGVPDPELGEVGQSRRGTGTRGLSPAPSWRPRSSPSYSRSLSRFKCPRSVDFVAELPRTPTGKLVKGILQVPGTPEPVSRSQANARVATSSSSADLVAEQQPVDLAAAPVQVRVVLPGVADAAVHLDERPGRPLQRLRRVRLDRRARRAAAPRARRRQSTPPTRPATAAARHRRTRRPARASRPGTSRSGDRRPRGSWRRRPRARRHAPRCRGLRRRAPPGRPAGRAPSAAASATTSPGCSDTDARPREGSSCSRPVVATPGAATTKPSTIARNRIRLGSVERGVGAVDHRPRDRAVGEGRPRSVRAVREQHRGTGRGRERRPGEHPAALLGDHREVEHAAAGATDVGGHRDAQEPHVGERLAAGRDRAAGVEGGPHRGRSGRVGVEVLRAPDA